MQLSCRSFARLHKRQPNPVKSAGTKIPNLRWWIIGLLLLATTINYIDRQTLSVAAPIITREFNLSATDYAHITYTFLFAYAIMQAVSGSLIDRIGAKLGFTLSIIWWSIANILHAFGTGKWSFAAYRLLLGMGEAGNYPAALKAISEWFPKAERANAVGILNAGPGLGALIAPPVMVWLIYHWGWRWAFVLTGALGFIWLIGWQKLYARPAEHARVTDEELALLNQDRQEPGQTGSRAPVLELLRHKEIWGVMLARFIADGGFYFITFWLPKYLADVRGFNLKQIGYFGWIPFLAADLGSLFGGWLGTRLMKQGYTLDRSRKLVIWLGTCLMPAAILNLYAPSPYVGLALIAVVMFATQVKAAALFTIPADLVRSQDVALVWGLSGAAGSLGGAFFQLIVGWLIDSYSYAPVFTLVVGLHFISTLLVIWLIPRVELLRYGTPE